MNGRNLLFVFTDQQTANAMSCAGNAELKTPSLDALAARGVRFTQTHATFPCCTPSRASFWTGRMPHEVGVDANDQPIDPEFRDRELGHVFSRAGYECVYGGKWHLPTMSLGSDEHGFRPISPIDDFHLTDRCIDFLQGPHERPFLMVASFDNPHNICEWTYEQPLPWGPVPEPPSLADCPNLPGNAAVFPYEPIALRTFQRARYRMLGTDTIDDDTWRRFRFAYYRLVEKVDAEIGRLLEALRETGLEENTTVVFTSDHGEMAGAHRMRQKWVLYEESVRVPLIAAGPGVTRRGETEDALVSNGLDLFPTFCDLCDVRPPEGLRGRSLIPLLEDSGAAIPWREKLFAETYYDDIRVHARMVRSRRYKYIAHSWGKDREQLFDLDADPLETVNLAVESRYAEVLDEHRQALADWCEQTGDRFGRHYAHPEVSFIVPGAEYGAER